MIARHRWLPLTVAVGPHAFSVCHADRGTVVHRPGGVASPWAGAMPGLVEGRSHCFCFWNVSSSFSVVATPLSACVGEMAADRYVASRAGGKHLWSPGLRHLQPASKYPYLSECRTHLRSPSIHSSGTIPTVHSVLVGRARPRESVEHRQGPDGMHRDAPTEKANAPGPAGFSSLSRPPWRTPH
jgi:hypothetical protein